MNITDLITNFKDLTGRTDMTDAQIISLLNSGQRLLDDMHQEPARYLISGEVNKSFYLFPSQPKSIDNITLVDGTSRYDVLSMSIRSLNAMDNTLPAARTAGLPSYYAISTIRKVSSASVPSGQTGKIDIDESGTSTSESGVSFDKPFDKTYLIDIYGKFYSTTITPSSADTFWTASMPFTLLHGAVYYMEIGFRNTEGARDCLAAITHDLSMLDKHLATKQARDINKMEG